MLPTGWTPCRSTAIEGYRYLPSEGILQIVFRQGRKVYDYPCDRGMFESFQVASSKGRYIDRVLKPYAKRKGWSVRPRRFSG